MRKTGLSRRNFLQRTGPPVLLSAVWLVSAIGAHTAAQGPPGEPPPAPVVVAEVHRCDVPVGPTFVGTVVPKRTSVVGSPVEGRVVELLVNEGDCVVEGQPLAQLRTDSLAIQLAAEKAELDLLELELEQLIISQPKKIAEANARMAAAKELYTFALHRLNRNRELSQENSDILSEDTLEELASAAETALKVHDERTAGWELTRDVSPKLIAQAEARVRVQQENIRKMEDDIAQHTICAPFDGYVTREQTEVGQWVAKGDSIVEVVELSEVDVEVPVLETYVSHLMAKTAQQPGTITRRIRVEALPGETFSGEVVAIVPQADVRSRSFPVKVRVKNRPGKCPQSMMLKPGMFVRVDLPLGPENSMLVPKDAIVLGGPSPMVWLVQRPSGSKTSGPVPVSPVPVELGIALEDWIEVQGPLEPGAEVVIEGNERIKPGSPVRILRVVKFGDRRSGIELRGGR